jgi:hypothetical protein
MLPAGPRGRGNRCRLRRYLKFGDALAEGVPLFGFLIHSGRRAAARREIHVTDFGRPRLLGWLGCAVPCSRLRTPRSRAQLRPNTDWYRLASRLGRGLTMALDFPNPSRSYDATLRAVRFWGHDGAMEASFFVSRDALQRIQPSVRSDEESLLRAFDLHRKLIHAAAAKVYQRERRALYELKRDDF